MATRKPAKPAVTPPAGPAVGELFALAIPGGRFAVVQVLSVTEASLELATLDRTFDRLPALDEVRGARVARVTFGAWDGAPARLCVAREVPDFAVRLGQLPPVETFAAGPTSYGAWENAVFTATMQHRWDHVFTPEERALRSAPAREVSVDLGFGAVTLSSASWRTAIGPNATPGFVVPPAGRVRWEALDAVPGLSDVSYGGEDARFADFLRRRRTITQVGWNPHELTRIELGDTLLSTLSVNAANGPLEVVVPAGLLHLTLRTGAHPTRVELREPGFPPALDLACSGALPPPIAGLETLTTLTVRGATDVDLARLAGYSALRALTIYGARGAVRNLAALARLPALRTLSFHDLYRMEPAEFPARDALPALAAVEFRGLLKDHVPVLRARLAGVPRVAFHGARSAAWVDANLDNPFAEWDEAGAAFGRAACAAWRTAMTQAGKLGRAAKKPEARAVLKSFVLALNALDAKAGGAIDTIRREEAGEAFARLGARFDAVTAGELGEWFDEWRDF